MRTQDLVVDLDATPSTVFQRMGIRAIAERRMCAAAEVTRVPTRTTLTTLRVDGAGGLAFAYSVALDLTTEPPLGGLLPDAITKSETWRRLDSSHYEADVAFVVSGAPGRADGFATLGPAGPDGSRLCYSVSVQVDIPLLGRAMEPAALTNAMACLRRDVGILRDEARRAPCSDRAG